MAITNKGQATKERILGVCAKLFLEQGYKKTTVSDITRLAGVSNSSFQHFFGAKDGVLTEMVEFMFANMFDAASALTNKEVSPAFSYILGAVVQLAIAEIDDNVREIYIEAYTHEKSLDFIQHATGKKVRGLFGSYQPELTEDDFYALVVGTTGIMRSFMARPCDDSFTLDTKIHYYVVSELRVYRLPEEEIHQVLGYLGALDIRAVAQSVLREAVQNLATRYEFESGR